MLSQATPPGLHMIYLPFQDDLRFPEEDPLLMKATPAPPRATSEQVAAAEQLIDQLTLEDFSCANVPNPAVANHYDVVEVRRWRCVYMGDRSHCRELGACSTL